jgi:hypothetical protein
MSHRSDCPDRWTAEREGERAFEYGRGRYANPYDDRDGCPEASQSWDDGFRRAERHDEERREEEAAARRARARREQEYLEEAAWYEQQLAEEADAADDFNEADYVRVMCGETAHEPHQEHTDRFGRRCVCGQVHWIEERLNGTT